MRVMQGMFPTTCKKCQRQKIYRGRNIARFTRITRTADQFAGPSRAFAYAGKRTASFRQGATRQHRQHWG